MLRFWTSLFLVALVSYGSDAGAQSPTPGGGLVPVFTIAKSENKNEVQYVVRLDDHCSPVGSAPVSAYWRMLEKGPTQTEPILSREVRAYGLASQTVAASDAGGRQVHAVMKALPGRPLTIVTSRASDGTCRALATTLIAGAPAQLFNVYVHIRGYGVDYAILQGWTMDGTHVVREKLKM